MATKTKAPAGTKSAETDEKKEGMAPEDMPEDRDEKEAEGDGKDKPAAGGQDEDRKASVSRADAAAIVTLCTEAGIPAMAASLIQDGATLEQARAKVDAAATIRAMVADARGVNATAVTAELGEELVKAGSVEGARKTLFEKLVSGQSPEIRSTVAAGATADTAGASGWDAAVAKVNAMHGAPAKK